MADSKPEPLSQSLEETARREQAVLKEIELSKAKPATDDATPQIELEKGRQDIAFRAPLFKIVTWLMCIEVGLMFVIVLLQGFGIFSFHLDQWVLASFEIGILAQTFGLAKIITKSLFVEQ